MESRATDANTAIGMLLTVVYPRDPTAAYSPSTAACHHPAVLGILPAGSDNLRKQTSSEEQQRQQQEYKPAFFSLPAELRNRIYQLINCPTSSSCISPQTSTKPHPISVDRLFTQPGYKITHVSHQLRIEASPVFFAHNTFKFYLCFPPPRWLFRVEEKYLKFISLIILEDYQQQQQQQVNGKGCGKPTGPEHPRPVCQSRIEIDLARLRDECGAVDAVGAIGEPERREGDTAIVRKSTDRWCRECERRRNVRPAKLEGIVRGLVQEGTSDRGGEKERQSPKLTRERLLAMFDAARYHYGEESSLAGIDERVID